MGSTDRAGLGAFLRARRAALQPEDVGLRRGSRRRTSGLRREEVAALCDVSSDYVARLERGDGPTPSRAVVAAIARGLRLTPAERDHLFVLAGHRPPPTTAADEHVNPGLLRVLDRLDDTPAQVMGALGQTLVQTPPAVALLGEQTRFTGPARSATYRWFTDPATRSRYAQDEHEHTSRVNVSLLRTAAARDGTRSDAAGLVELLRRRSSEFAHLWDRQEVGLQFSGVKRFVHPEVGELELFCQTLLDPDQRQSLLVFTATPGTTDQERLALLAVLGTDSFATPDPH